MTLEQANNLIQECAQRMDSLYRKPVFDEWAIVAFTQAQGRVLSYIGPRKADFQKSFGADIKDLRVELLSNTHGIGDFEFARHGVGTKAEAFMVVGQGIYLICNNMQQDMDTITKDPLWLNAQVPFVELSEKFRGDRVIV
jgi:hypothetical protein